MRKKAAKDECVDGRRREREESIGMAHRKAAALAWYRHGRKGTIVLGSGKGKMQNPFSHALAAPHQGNATSSSSVSDAKPSHGDENSEIDMGSVPISHAPCHTLHSQANVLSPVPQISRFKSEALALHSSSSPHSSMSATPSSPLPHTTNPNKQQLINMSTGQSLALLSLLPHHQSQKCFNLSKTGYGGRSSSNDDDNNNTTAWDCGSSLYDSFELLCLSNQLGRCLTTVNAAAMASSVTSSSRLLKNLTTPTLQGPPLQPSYIPRSLYALPQFMIPNYLVKKASKKRSSLIHPVFSMPSSTTSSPSLPALPPSPSSAQGNQSSTVAEDQVRKKVESGGFRRVFNSLLKTLHMKEDHKPKRSNLSEELGKLPKDRPLSIARGPPLLQEGTHMTANRPKPTTSFASPATAMASKESPKSSSTSPTSSPFSKKTPTSSSFSAAAAAAAAAMASKRSPNLSSVYTFYEHHHHFRNEGFRTTTIKPSKPIKWAQPGTA